MVDFLSPCGNEEEGGGGGIGSKLNSETRGASTGAARSQAGRTRKVHVAKKLDSHHRHRPVLLILNLSAACALLLSSVFEIEARIQGARTPGTLGSMNALNDLTTDGRQGSSKPALHGDWSAAGQQFQQLQQQQQKQERACGTRHSNKRATSDENLLYIVGGDEVEDERFWPWSVAIYELDPLNGRRGFICSGSLVSERFVLTAAHCIQQSRFDILTPDEVFLKLATVRLDDWRADFFQVDRVFLHPAYTSDRKTNDIALLRIRPGQRLPARARPICLPSQVANRIDFTDQQVTVIGWGQTSAMQGNEPTRLIDLIGSGGQQAGSGAHQQQQQQQQQQESATGQTNDTLLQAEVRVTSTDQCNRNYSRLEIDWLNIDEHFICASDPQGKRDACQGDSGGPLMWNDQQAALMGAGQATRQQQERAAAAAAEHAERWYQLGLVSFGYGCANNQYPGVYTRISYYMPWISKLINDEQRVPNDLHHQHHHH